MTENNIKYYMLRYREPQESLPNEYFGPEACACARQCDVCYEKGRSEGIILSSLIAIAIAMVIFSFFCVFLVLKMGRSVVSGRVNNNSAINMANRDSQNGSVDDGHQLEALLDVSSPQSQVISDSINTLASSNSRADVESVL